MNELNLKRPEPLSWTQSPTEPCWDQSEDLAHHPAGSDPIQRYRSCSLNMCSQARARSPKAAGPEPVLVLWRVGSLGPISSCKQEADSVTRTTGPGSSCRKTGSDPEQRS
uniref:PPUP8948 n=1 Tax=Poeciliopsis prolifica TaxID=188132 RepID=A0A0S7ERC2_9TELE